MDSRKSRQLPWYQSETSAGNTKTHGEATIQPTASLVPMNATIRDFTISVRPFVYFRGAKATLKGWNLTVDEEEPGQDPLLQTLVSQHADTYVQECLGRTLRQAAYEEPITEYIDAYDQYVWPRRGPAPSNSTAAASSVAHGFQDWETGTAHAIQSEQHCTASVSHRFFSARRTLMAIAVNALSAESLVLREKVEHAYLSQTGKATCVTVSFLEDLVVQEPQEP